MREVLYQKFGVDLTAIEGIGVTTALVVLAEVGPECGLLQNREAFLLVAGALPG